MVSSAKLNGNAPANGNGSDKSKAVEQAISQVEKQFGKGSIMRLGESLVSEVAIIPTGSLSLDIALGVGGIPGAGSSNSSGQRPPARPCAPSR